MSKTRKFINFDLDDESEDEEEILQTDQDLQEKTVYNFEKLDEPRKLSENITITTKIEELVYLKILKDYYLISDSKLKNIYKEYRFKILFLKLNDVEKLLQLNAFPTNPKNLSCDLYRQWLLINTLASSN